MHEDNLLQKTMKIKEVQIIKIAKSIVIEVEENEFKLQEANKLVRQYIETNKLDGVENVIVRFTNKTKKNASHHSRNASHHSRVGYYTVTIENPELIILNECAGYIAYITHSNESCENLAMRIVKAEGVIGHFEHEKAIRIKEGIEKNTPFRVSIKPTAIIMDEA